MKYELITIGGKERAIRYGFWALAQFCEMCNIKLSELGRLEKDLFAKFQAKPKKEKSASLKKK